MLEVGGEVVGGPGGLDGHGYGERGGKLRGRRVDPPAAVRSPLPRVLDVPPRRVLPPAAGLRPSLPPSGAPASGAASMAELRRRRRGLNGEAPAGSAASTSPARCSAGASEMEVTRTI